MSHNSDDFKGVGEEAGLEIWRVECLKLVRWPAEKYNKFFDGDSYLVLHV